MRTLARRAPDVSRRFVLLRVLAAVLAGAVALACGATPIFVTVAPATDLELHFEITGAYGSLQGQVQLRVTIEDPSKGPDIALTRSHRLTCDGVSDPNEFTEPRPSASFVVPRVAPGGTYTCTYTDERGRNTTATIGIPAGRFAITTPSAGAEVPIPGPLGPDATGTATVNPAPPTETVDQPLIIHYDFPSPPGYMPPSSGTSFFPPPQGPYALVCAATAATGSGIGMIPTAPPVLCPPQFGGDQAATGTYTFSDTRPAPGFYTCFVEPAFIYLTLKMRWSLSTRAFRQIQVDTTDNTAIPITWVTAPKCG